MNLNENAGKTENKHTNLTYLRNLTKNNTGMIREMIEVYIEETPQLIHKMKEALFAKNWDALRMAAHSIIPSFATMGIDSRYEANAKTIQEKAILLRDGKAATGEKETVAELNTLFTQVEMICEKACTELQQELPASK